MKLIARILFDFKCTFLENHFPTHIFLKMKDQLLPGRTGGYTTYTIIYSMKCIQVQESSKLQQKHRTSLANIDSSIDFLMINTSIWPKLILCFIHSYYALFQEEQSMIAIFSEVKMHQKRNQESIIDCISLVVYQFQRRMVSLCGKWKHFTSLVCGLIPHSGLSSRTGEDLILCCCSHFSAKEGQALVLTGCSTFAQAPRAEPSHLQCLCTSSPAMASGALRTRLKSQKVRAWSLCPCIAQPGMVGLGAEEKKWKRTEVCKGTIQNI